MKSNATPHQWKQRPEDTPTTFWWLGDKQGVIYFLRELTGLGIAIYTVGFVVMFCLDPSANFVGTLAFSILSWLGLISAVFHSITWFAVTVKVTPFDLPKWMEWGGLVGLFVAWGGVSYALMSFLYEVSLPF